MASAAKKGSLSNGILALKFMQKGPAADSQKAHTKTQPAVVQDDGKWEIGRDVKESWGMDADVVQNVTYEESYLPFLTPEYASTSSAPAAGGGGRKSFGRFNRALEPKAEEEEQTADMTADAQMPTKDDSDDLRSDDLPAARKLVVTPGPLMGGEKSRRPNALRAIPQPVRRGVEQYRTPLAGSREERRGQYTPREEGRAREEGFMRFDGPREAGGKGGGRKRKSEGGADGMDSRRAKKPKKQARREED